MTGDVEDWRAVVGFEGRYEVSNLGNVRAIPRRNRRNIKAARPKAIWTGYLYVPLRGDGGKDYFKAVHLLVLTAFVGPRPSGLVACHNNGVKTDNRVENLRWDTQSNNVREGYLHGRIAVHGDRHPNTKLKDDDVVAIRQLLSQGVQGKEIAARYNVCPSTISAIKTGKKRKHTIVSTNPVSRL